MANQVWTNEGNWQHFGFHIDIRLGALVAELVFYLEE
jgi:hypothetical protein